MATNKKEDVRKSKLRDIFSKETTKEDILIELHRKSRMARSYVDTGNITMAILILGEIHSIIEYCFTSEKE